MVPRGPALFSTAACVAWSSLRCLVIDLKLGEFTHADAGQMHLYLNYARAHGTHPGENPPVGLILCEQKDAVAHDALDGLLNTVLAAEYRTVEYRATLPDEATLTAELARTRQVLENRGGKDSCKMHTLW